MHDLVFTTIKKYNNKSFSLDSFSVAVLVNQKLYYRPYGFIDTSGTESAAQSVVFSFFSILFFVAASFWAQA